MGRGLVARGIGIMEVDVRSPQFLRHPPHPVRGTWSRQQAGAHPARKKSVPGKARRAPHTSHHPKIQGFCPISYSVLYGIGSDAEVFVLNSVRYNTSLLCIPTNIPTDGTENSMTPKADTRITVYSSETPASPWKMT
jgi:hypothetical protein